jgi:GT2 family glycosyltransferase
MPTLAIIIVSWNTRDLLRRCISSVQAALAGAPFPYGIIVVDNGSRDGTPQMLRAELPEIELIESRRNLGFAGGNNQALRRLAARGWRLSPHGESAQVDAVLLLNSDTEVAGDAIQRMLMFLERHPDVAVVGPRLRYADGSVQSSRRRFPQPGTFFFESTPLETYWPRNPWARRYRMEDRPDDQQQDVDWLVGAALLVRRSVFEDVGLLDAGFQMYSEELEWQRRIRASKPTGRIVYLPEAEVVHHEGKSSEQALARRYINFQRSRLRYVRLVHGERLARAVRLALRLAYTVEMAVEGAKWLVGHRRPLRAQRLGVYAKLLRHL